MLLAASCVPAGSKPSAMQCIAGLKDCIALKLKEQKAKLPKDVSGVSGVSGVNVRSTESANSECNGFPSLPDQHTIDVQAQHIAPFSLPEECFTYRPAPGAIVLSFKNGDSERMISCNTRLSMKELSMLRSLQERVAREKKSFLPSVSVAAVRYLGDHHFDVEGALQHMMNTQSWRLKYFPQPLQDMDLVEDFRKGFIYFCGRDNGLRPALVMRAGRAPGGIQSEQFGRLFVFCMEYFLRFMMVPGRVENIVVLIDLKDLSYSQIPSVSALMELKEVLTKQDAGRVYRFYVCNLPFIVRALLGVVQAAMTERQRQKMRFVTDVASLREDFALHQLEEDLGGVRPLERVFLPFPLPPGA